MAEAKIEVVLSNGSKAGDTLKELGKTANTLNKEIRNLKPGTEEFAKKAADLQAVEKQMGKIKTEIKGTSAASDALKAGLGGVLGQVPGFGALSGVLSQAKGGVGGLTSGFGQLRGAIAATGIGALVIIVGALITALSKFTPLIDKVEQIMSGLSAVVSELTQRLQNFASGLWDIITGVPGGVDKMASSFDGLSESITGAYNAGVELKQLQQDLDDQNRSIVLTNAKQEAQIDRLILQSKNRSLSLKEQNELLQQATKIAEDNYATNAELDKKNLDALLREAALDSKLSHEEILRLAEGTLATEDEYKRRGTLSDDLLQKITDAQVKVIEGEGKNNSLLEKINNREAAIREKQEAEREKAARAAEKRADDLSKAEEKRLKEEEDAHKLYNDAIHDLEDKRLAMMSAGRAKDIAQVELNLKRQIEAIDANAPLYAERVAAAQDLARQQKDTVNEKWDDKEAADQLAKNELALATDQNALNEQLLARQITQQQYIELSAQNAINYQAKELDLLKASHGEQSAEYQRAYAEYLSLQQAQADAAVDIKKKEMDDQLAAVQGTLGTFGNFFGQLASMQKKGTAQAKAFTVAQAIMSTLQSSIAAYESTVKIPYVGPALAPIAAAGAFAFGMSNVRKIQDTKEEAPTKAARGMVLRGPSHRHGGIPIEAEGDEIILTKGVYRNPHLRRVASELNVAGGGVKFANGGPVSPFNQSPGGTISSPASAGASAAIQARPEWVDDIIAAQDRRMDRIKVINVVTETEEGIKKVENIRSQADV